MPISSPAISNGGMDHADGLKRAVEDAAGAGAVFLSYSRTDRNACIALKSALEQVGLKPFRDEDAIRAGDRWLSRLEQALVDCSAFVVLVGRDGIRRWVGAEVQVALSRHLSPPDDAPRLPIFPVLLDGAQADALPPFLALFQSARWTPGELLPQELLAAIRSRAVRFEAQPAIEGCPFLGLNAFGRGDARLFFGRRRETLEALACLGDQQQTNPDDLSGGDGGAYHRWLQIEGNSGAGKSSLVQAGMLPMIEQGALWGRTGFERWTLLGPMMPGRDPLARLAEVLEQALVPDPTQRDSLRRLKRLEEDERSLAFALRDARQDGGAFLLIVDQFEELFTFADDTPRRRFDALLARALQDPDCPLFLISTVRADFLDRFEQLPALQQIYNHRCKRYFLPTISEQGLREIIEEPARLAHLDVGEVTTAILEDARGEIGALPLVENALYTLWLAREGDRLSGERYRACNGIAGMLSAQADALLARIGRAVPEGERAALELLLRLTRINDDGRHTRQRVSREEAVLVAGGGRDADGERVVQMLAGERRADAPGGNGLNGALRLITTSSEGDARYVDLIHETLLRARSRDPDSGERIGYWPTLYRYIEENRDRDLVRQQLRFQSERWQRSRGLGRVWHLGLIGLGQYRPLRLPPGSDEARFLAWSRRARGALLACALLVIVYVGESYLWTKRHELPLDAVLSLQRFRLGYAPTPTLVDIAAPGGPVELGEQDQSILQRIPDRFFRNFGSPGTRADVATGFRLGKYEVTYDEYDYYVWHQHRSGNGGPKYPTTAKGGRGSRPVVNVNWHEAGAYADWLGERRGEKCRLPTEAEWEYAARAGTDSAYPWGDDPRLQTEDGPLAMANCDGCGSPWDNEQSAPVGQFRANGFGLHDMSGNVWEWTCSAWQDSFDGSEGSCAELDEGGSRAVRGGSWILDAVVARSSARYVALPDFRYVDIGFRVLCWSPIE